MRVAILDDYQGAAASQVHWEKLAGRISLESFRDTLLDESELVERLQPYPIVVAIRERSVFPANVLRQLPALELLCFGGRNSGQVDLSAATLAGITVTETAGSGPSAIETTMALILAVAHRVVEEDRAMRRGLWQTGIGFDLSGKTLGVVGLGRIGSRIATFGRHLGMRVVAWSANLAPEKAESAGAVYASLDDLLTQSDVITLHLRLSDRTRGIITGRHISLLKPTACLVNTARGHLLDEQALVLALQEHRIRGAALDVFHTEPLPVDHPLRSLDNVLLSPHMGYVTAETYDQFFSQVVASIEQFLNGCMPSGAVNPEALAVERPNQGM